MESITTSQVLFLVALAAVAIVILAFAVFMLSTTVWGATQRWQARKHVRRN